MHLVHYLFITFNIVNAKGWPCNLCREYSTNDDCWSASQTPIWSLPFREDVLDQADLLSATVKMEPANVVKGMHNEIVTKVQITRELDEGRIFPYLLVQKVPSSFYIDQYELQRLDLGIVRSYFRSNIDVELPQHMSKDAIVLYYFSPDMTWTSIMEFAIPWHSRYHECSYGDSTHTNATIPPPMLYTSCVSKGLCDKVHSKISRERICSISHEALHAPCSHNDTSQCVWIPVAQGTGGVTVQIPVGQSKDGHFVTVATLLSTVLGTLSVCLGTIKYTELHGT